MSIKDLLFSTILQNKHIKVLIAYGSETGNVEAISKILFNKIKLHNKNIVEMNEIIDMKPLEEYDYIFFLVSTTGRGDFPENARKFWRIIRKNRDPIKIKYSLIGFGDSNYRSFCHTAKCLSRKLKKAEAEEIFPMVLIDDALDHSPKIDKWIEDVSLFLTTKQTEASSIFTRLMNN